MSRTVSTPRMSFKLSDVTTDTSLVDIPDLQLPGVLIKLPRWTRWLVRWILKPLIPQLFKIIRPLAIEIARWIWRIAYKISGQRISEVLPLGAAITVRKAMEDLEKEIINIL